MLTRRAWINQTCHWNEKTNGQNPRNQKQKHHNMSNRMQWPPNSMIYICHAVVLCCYYTRCQLSPTCQPFYRCTFLSALFRSMQSTQARGYLFCIQWVLTCSLTHALFSIVLRLTLLEDFCEKSLAGIRWTSAVPGGWAALSWGFGWYLPLIVLTYFCLSMSYLKGFPIQVLDLSSDATACLAWHTIILPLRNSFRFPFFLWRLSRYVCTRLFPPGSHFLKAGRAVVGAFEI